MTYLSIQRAERQCSRFVQRTINSIHPFAVLGTRIDQATKKSTRLIDWNLDATQYSVGEEAAALRSDDNVVFSCE